MSILYFLAFGHNLSDEWSTAWNEQVLTDSTASIVKYTLKSRLLPTNIIYAFVASQCLKHIYSVLLLSTNAVFFKHRKNKRVIKITTFLCYGDLRLKCAQDTMDIKISRRALEHLTVQIYV